MVFVYLGQADVLETIGIFIAILLATFVSTWAEFSNENAFRRLQEEASRITCKVWRDGQPVEIPIDDIVRGDAVQLEAGDKVAVDGVLLSGSVKLDQAALNGESEEAEKARRRRISPGARKRTSSARTACTAAPSSSKARASCVPKK